MNCEDDNCNEKGTCIAYSRKENKVGVYCDTHGKVVVKYSDPEYTCVCPNCGCNIPVN